MSVKTANASTGKLDLGKTIVGHIGRRSSNDMRKSDPNPDARITRSVDRGLGGSVREAETHDKGEHKQRNQEAVTKRSRH
jgi:hypothetical protein